MPVENYAVRKSQSNANRYSAQFESHRHVNRPILLNMFFLAGKISQPLNKVCTQTPHPELNNNESNLTYELLGSKGAPLNNNDLNSLYVNEPGLSTRVSKRQCFVMKSV